MSSRNPPPNLGELLLQPNFGQSRPLDKPGDPIVPTQLLLDVALIRRYEQDPRQHANPQYEEIKASILAQGGINNPLTVTRRPGDEHYIIEAGGNTRLRVLQELWAETGDERFHFTHVLFKPWESESQILTRHLIENELRGEMLFVDKALGLEALRRQWAAESGSELADGEFHRRLKASGFAISRRAITRLRFAAQIAPSLVQATADPSFGREVVDRIMALHGAARRIWVDNALLEAEFPAAWERALIESDSPEFSLVALQHNLARILGEWISGKDAGDISLELDCLIYERRGEAPSEPLPSAPPFTEPGAAVSAEAPPLVDQAPDAQPEPSRDWPEADAVDPEPAPWSDDVADPPESPAMGAVDPGKGRANAPRGAFGPGAIPSPIPVNDLKSLKSRAYVLAQRIAQHYRMGPIIAPAPQTHFGFILTDIPHNTIDETTKHIPIEQVWWLLYGFCHQEEIDAALLDRLAPADSEFRRFAPSCDPIELAGILLDKDPPLNGPVFMRAISTVDDRELQDVIDLMATYRELRAHFLRNREGRR